MLDPTLHAGNENDPTTPLRANEPPDPYNLLFPSRTLKRRGVPP